MRIRKILPLALLAVGAVFMLTSCAQILDAIFSSNTIQVTAKVLAPYYGTGSGQTVQFTLTRVSTGETTTGTSGTSGSVDSYGYVYYTFEFNKLANDTYTLTSAYSGPRLGFAGPWVTTAFYVDDSSGSTTPVSSVALPYTSGNATSVSLTTFFN